MGRTIPSFRIAAVLEEKEWKYFRKYLNKNDKKAFDNMFSISRLYNSACSYAVNPIRIHPIMMSIVLHNYKTLKEIKFVKSFSSSNFNDSDNNNNTNSNDTIILKKK